MRRVSEPGGGGRSRRRRRRRRGGSGGGRTGRGAAAHLHEHAGARRRGVGRQRHQLRHQRAVVRSAVAPGERVQRLRHGGARRPVHVGVRAAHVHQGAQRRHGGRRVQHVGGAEVVVPAGRGGGRWRGWLVGARAAPERAPRRAAPPLRRRRRRRRGRRRRPPERDVDVRLQVDVGGAVHQQRHLARHPGGRRRRQPQARRADVALQRRRARERARLAAQPVEQRAWGGERRGGGAVGERGRWRAAQEARAAAHPPAGPAAAPARRRPACPG